MVSPVSFLGYHSCTIVPSLGKLFRSHEWDFWIQTPFWPLKFFEASALLTYSLIINLKKEDQKNQRLKYEEQWAEFRYLNENWRTLTTLTQAICYHQSPVIAHFASPEYYNASEPEENGLKTKFMTIIEVFKEKMKKIPYRNRGKDQFSGMSRSGSHHRRQMQICCRSLDLGWEEFLLQVHPAPLVPGS